MKLTAAQIIKEYEYIISAVELEAEENELFHPTQAKAIIAKLNKAIEDLLFLRDNKRIIE